MNEVNLPDELLYIGLDVCGDLIKSNQELYGSARRLFMKADITVDPLPKCDLIMCRDCLFHLPFANCFDFFRNFLSSGTPYLLLTTHLNSSNLELPDDKGFRKLNMLKPPFSFSEQLALLRDYPDGAAERYMGLWSSEAIRSCIHLG